MNRDTRIGIIGGGLAGLSAGHFLRRAGYTRLTVLEQAAQPGGKCDTLQHGRLDCELGAAIVGPGYPVVRQLVRETGLTLRPLASWGECGLRDVENNRPVQFTLGRKIHLLELLTRFLLLRLRHPAIARPGFAGADPALAEPFGPWLERHGLGELRPAFAPFQTGYGYGYDDEVPAAYGLKFFAPLWALPSLLGRGLSVVDEGYQALAAALARPLDFRGYSEVERIEPGREVRVRVRGGDELLFDRVILACAPTRLASLVRGDPELAADLGLVRHYHYHTFAAPVTGLAGSVLFLPAHFRRETGAGRLGFAYTRRPGGLTVLNVLAPTDMAAGEILARVRKDVARLGGQMGEVVTHRLWQYFPHPGPSDFVGFHDRLEARQGRGGLYVAGELMTFPSTETVCQYSRHLVSTHFL